MSRAGVLFSSLIHYLLVSGMWKLTNGFWVLILTFFYVFLLLCLFYSMNQKSTPFLYLGLNPGLYTYQSNILPVSYRPGMKKKSFWICKRHNWLSHMPLCLYCLRNCQSTANRMLSSGSVWTLLDVISRREEFDKWGAAWLTPTGALQDSAPVLEGGNGAQGCNRRVLQSYSKQNGKSVAACELVCGSDERTVGHRESHTHSRDRPSALPDIVAHRSR